MNCRVFKKFRKQWCRVKGWLNCKLYFLGQSIFSLTLEACLMAVWLRVASVRFLHNISIMINKAGNITRGEVQRNDRKWPNFPPQNQTLEMTPSIFLYSTPKFGYTAFSAEAGCSKWCHSESEKNSPSEFEFFNKK